MVDRFIRDANLDRYRDIDFNFTAHPVTGSLTTLTGAAAIKRALKNLILVQFYDVTFDPSFGSQVNNLLFENVDPTTASDIEERVREIIDIYEPRVEVDDVSVIIDADAQTAEVTIAFMITSEPAPITTSIIIQRNK